MLTKHVIMSAIAITLLSPAVSSGSTETQLSPAYELAIKLDLEKKRCDGRVFIHIPDSAVGDGKVSFDISYGEAGVDVRKVTDDAGRELVFTVRDDIGRLEVEPGKSRIVAVEYSFPVDETALKPFGYYKFSGSPLYPELLEAGGDPFRFSDFEVSFEYPPALSVLTTGGAGEPRDGEARTSAKYSVKHAAGFAIVAGEGFVVDRREDKGVPVVAFYHPDYAEKFSTVIERTVEAAAWYKKTYGFFPLERVGIVQGHPTWGGGYPLPNMFAVHLGGLDEKRITWITAHELGHYYWGYTVLNPTDELAWLQLSLGIWADQLYLAEREGISIEEQWRDGLSFTRYFTAMVANHNQTIGLPRGEAKELNFDYNSLIRHGKAAVGAYLQSLLIGRERFLELQRRILEEYRHRPLPESDYFSILSEYGSEDAGAFYEAWKRGDATIGMFVRGVSPNETGDGWTVELGRTGPVPYPVEVEAISGDGKKVHHVVEASSRKDQFDVDFVPVDIRIDPRGLIPMPSSSHPEVQMGYALAHERNGLDDPFFAMAGALLDENPDNDYLRYRVARRLYELARWEQCAALWNPDRGIDGRDGLLVALYSARALSKLGRQSEALGRLEGLKAPAEQNGLLDFWEKVRNEAGD